MSESNDFNRFAGTDGYIASPSLIDAVNCAIALERPLLIRGEPGTGKTLLARHIAEALEMPLERWHVKSTSKAAEGLYVYDTVQRLNDSRFGGGDFVGYLGEGGGAGQRGDDAVDLADHLRRRRDRSDAAIGQRSDTPGVDIAPDDFDAGLDEIAGEGRAHDPEADDADLLRHVILHKLVSGAVASACLADFK